MADYRIVRLQVQRGPVKVGKAPMRSYQPSAIVPVDRIVAGPRGVRGLTADGEEILDVHHQDHAQSRDPKGRAGILFMGTGDYVALRERYGDHVVDGIAGETVLLDAAGGLAPLRLPSVVTVTTVDGPLQLRDVREADPCVEFSRFCLRQELAPTVDDAVRQALVDLDHGARGYRAIAAGAATVRVGDMVTI
jgi:acetolactate synthase regulatory subunit